MKKVKLIYNSIAGQSKFKYFLDTIVEKFAESGYEVSLFRASKKNTYRLEEYLKHSEDCYAIVIAGGDGTINRVVNVMMKNNIKVPIGIIPAGTSNDFAKHIKMPGSFSKSIDKILEGNIQDVDVGLANDKYFINVCSAGVCTNASQKTDIALKNIFGRISYIFTAMYEFFKFKPFEVKIETNTDIYIEKINLFLVFNGSSVGRIEFSDSSNIQDGLLDVIIIKNCTFSEASILLTKILAGKYLDDKNVIYLKEPYIKISRIKGKCDDPDVDGDEGPQFPLEIKCIEKGLKMFL